MGATRPAGRPHAQIDLFGTAFAITLYELLPAPNGGSTRVPFPWIGHAL